MGYTHTQRGPLGVLFVVTGTALAVLAWALWSTTPVGVVLAVMAAAFGFLAVALSSLRVEDRGAFLDVRYGPLPLFGTTVRYSSIASVEAGRTAIIDGWGIHYIPGRGWTFNLWGRGCVVIRSDGRGLLRIGTDDAPNLARFLKAKVGVDGPAL